MIAGLRYGTGDDDPGDTIFNAQEDLPWPLGSATLGSIVVLKTIETQKLEIGGRGRVSGKV